MFLLFHSIVYVFTEFILILLKVLGHIHNCYFKVLVLCLNYIAFLRAYSNRVSGFWRRYIDLVTHVYVFTLGSRNYGIWNYVGVDICLVFSK